MSLSYYAPAHTYGQPKVKQIPSVSPSPNKERKTEKENKEREKREKEKKKERKRKKEKRKSEKNCRVMDGWTDGQRDGRIDRRMDGLTNIDIGCMALGEKKLLVSAVTFLGWPFSVLQSGAKNGRICSEIHKNFKRKLVQRKYFSWTKLK